MEKFEQFFSGLWDALVASGPMAVILQLLVIAAAAVAAFFLHQRSQDTLQQRLLDTDVHVLRKTILKIGQRLAFPLIGLFAVLVGGLVFRQFGIDTLLLKLAFKLLLALALVRMVVYSLRIGLAPGPALKAWETIISTTIWVLVAVRIIGLEPAVMNMLDQIAFSYGETRISLLMALRFIVLSAFYILVALWVAGLVENRVKRAEHINASMRVGISKITRVVLLTVAILMALTEAGVNLSSLTIFGGALGVGIGFGLQKIVSNFISGFILLGDRSIKPGDVITVGTSYGWVKELNARYIVVRNRDGVETLIPNENLVTSEVINWSFSDKRVRLRIPVQISYDDDPEEAMQIMAEAAFASSRVLKVPEPAVRLMEFADSGIALELRVWLTDPEEGVGSVRSDVNLAIWHGFKKAGITIPYPQRDVHLRQVDVLPAPTD